MLIDSKCEMAEATIRRNLVARLEGEGLVSARRARQLAKAELDDVLSIVFRHTRRVVVPFADTVLILEPKEALQ